MSGDILDRIDETLTFYSAGLNAELTVPIEYDNELVVTGDGSIFDELRVWLAAAPPLRDSPLLESWRTATNTTAWVLTFEAS